MALTTEWRKRIDHWQRVLPSLFYRPLAEVELAGYETSKQMTLAEALKGKFKAMPEGTPWGAKWAYAWFRAQVKLPRGAAGEWIIFRAATGGETAVFLDGASVGAFDHEHRDIVLSRKAKAGAAYEMIMEAYGGHGARECGGGPVPDGVETVPEPPAQQTCVGKTTVGIWEEEAYQLWMDVNTLVRLRDVLPVDSLRVQDIDAGLRDYSVLCDPELPRQPFLASVRKARQRLKPLFACVNGSTAPLLYCYGHSHIDVAWLWPLQETERKCSRTFGTQLALMDDYPEFKFLQSQPHLFRMVKQRYPELYVRLQQAAKRGQLIPEGGMWVEADTNISGGEALIRQFIHGKRFFREEFGVECEMMWLPDVFGYSGAMPQIMLGCGIRYFSTQKIFWNYNGGEGFPYNTFWWEGIDGSRILSHFHNDYNSQSSPREVADRWNNRVQKDGIRTRLFPFGHGDGGGGPTRDHLEYLRRQGNLEGLPRTVMASPIDYFHEQERETAHLPTYVGELYFQCHRGTYTTQARTKRGNRTSELALREAEMWASAAASLAGYTVPAADLDEAWKGVLLNQFHDIIPGSSIHRVYEEAEALYAKVKSVAAAATAAAQAKLLKADRNALTVFNSLSWGRPALVKLPAGFKGAKDAAGKVLPVQKVGKELLAEVAEVPACGWTTLTNAAPATLPTNTLKATTRKLENAFLLVTFDAYGQITSLLDKESGRELADGACNQLCMYKDVPAWFDAWDVDSTYKAVPVELSAKAEITVEQAGPLVATLRIERQLNESRLVQRVHLRRDSRRLDFETEIDWQERHKLLKVNFPTTVVSDVALHEIQFGHLARPTHQSRQFDADRFEVSMHKWSALTESNRGVALLNDCKYGCDVNGGSLNLTLLRATMAPDMTADLGKQIFTYSFYSWNGSFMESGLVREAYDVNVPVGTASGKAAKAVQSLFGVDVPNVIVETVKPAEDGSGDVVVRLYEAKRSTTRCTLATSLPFKKAALVNMLETDGKAMPLKAGQLALDFGPFEIKTVRFSR